MSLIHLKISVYKTYTIKQPTVREIFIMSNTVFAYLDSIIPFAPLLSAIAALSSCYVAWTVKNTNKSKETAKFKSDLYCVFTNLISIEHYLQMAYNTRNIATQSDTILIINSIKNISKQTISINNNCFYNDQLTAASLQEICRFFQEYTIWQGWKIIDDIDIFQELRLIYSVRISALNALKTLFSDYSSDKRVEKIIGDLTNIDTIISNISHCHNFGKFISANLSLIFYENLLFKSYSDKEKQNIVVSLLQILLREKKPKNPIIDFLFNDEIVCIELISSDAERKAIGTTRAFPIKEIIAFLDSITVQN